MHCNIFKYNLFLWALFFPILSHHPKLRYHWGGAEFCYTPFVTHPETQKGVVTSSS